VGPLVNPEYGVDIQMVKVTDYGNIEFKDKENILAPEKAISKVSEEILSLLHNHQLPFIFGGAKEGAYGA
jgi:arginase family enzyme